MKKLRVRVTQKTKTHPIIVGPRPFAAEEIRKFIDPSPPDEAEEFVRLIYTERRRDRERPFSE